MTSIFLKQPHSERNSITLVSFYWPIHAIFNKGPSSSDNQSNIVYIILMLYKCKGGILFSFLFNNVTRNYDHYYESIIIFSSCLVKSLRNDHHTFQKWNWSVQKCFDQVSTIWQRDYYHNWCDKTAKIWPIYLLESLKEQKRLLFV